MELIKEDFIIESKRGIKNIETRIEVSKNDLGCFIAKVQYREKPILKYSDINYIVNGHSVQKPIEIFERDLDTNYPWRSYIFPLNGPGKCKLIKKVKNYIRTAGSYII